MVLGYIQEIQQLEVVNKLLLPIVHLIHFKHLLDLIQLMQELLNVTSAMATLEQQQYLVLVLMLQVTEYLNMTYLQVILHSQQKD